MNTSPSLLERCLPHIKANATQATRWAQDCKEANGFSKRIIEYAKADALLHNGLLNDLEAAIAEQANLTYTGHLDADSALVMLDRMDVSADDDARVDAIAKTIRNLAEQAKPQEPVAWTDENVIAWCLKRGIEAAKDTPALEPMSESIGARDTYPCQIIEADFEKNTVTLSMEGHFQVSAGEYLLSKHGMGVKK